MAERKGRKDRRAVNVTLRLPASKLRAVRMALARKGTSLQAALEQAVDALIAQTEASTGKPENLRGLVSGTNVMELRERERRQEIEHDRSWL